MSIFGLQISLPSEEKNISREKELSRSYDVTKHQDDITTDKEKSFEAKDCQRTKDVSTETEIISSAKSIPPDFSVAKSPSLPKAKILGGGKRLSTSVEHLQTSEIKATKLKWREPSQEALNKLHSSQLAAIRQEVMLLWCEVGSLKFSNCSHILQG